MPFFTRCLTLRCGAGCSSSTSGGGRRPWSSTRVTSTFKTSWVRAPRFRSSTLTGVLTPFLFCFLMFFRFAAFYVAFIFRMPPHAAVSARHRAAEMVLVLYLLTIFIFLRALQLEHPHSWPITVMRLAGSTVIVRRTTVEKVWGPYTPGRGGTRHVLQLPTTALPRFISDLPPGDFSAGVALRRCLRRYLSMWESFPLPMANSINRSTRSS